LIFSTSKVNGKNDILKDKLYVELRTAHDCNLPRLFPTKLIKPLDGFE